MPPLVCGLVVTGAWMVGLVPWMGGDDPCRFGAEPCAGVVEPRGWIGGTVVVTVAVVGAVAGGGPGRSAKWMYWKVPAATVRTS